MSPSSKGTDEAVNDALLEKLRNCVSKPQEVDTFRNIAAKIHARVTSTGNQRSYLFLLFLFYIYIWLGFSHNNNCFRRISLFYSIFNWRVDGLAEQIRKERNIKKKKCFLSQFLFLYSFRRPTRGSNIGNKVFNSTRNKRLDSLRHGLVNCYFYRERWLLFHRANHQKLAQFIIRIVLVGGRIGVRAATL